MKRSLFLFLLFIPFPPPSVKRSLLGFHPTIFLLSLFSHVMLYGLWPIREEAEIICALLETFTQFWKVPPDVFSMLLTVYWFLGTFHVGICFPFSKDREEVSRGGGGWRGG